MKTCLKLSALFFILSACSNKTAPESAIKDVVKDSTNDSEVQVVELVEQQTLIENNYSEEFQFKEIHANWDSIRHGDSTTEGIVTKASDDTGLPYIHWFTLLLDDGTSKNFNFEGGEFSGEFTDYIGKRCIVDYSDKIENRYEKFEEVNLISNDENERDLEIFKGSFNLTEDDESGDLPTEFTATNTNGSTIDLEGFIGGREIAESGKELNIYYSIVHRTTAHYVVFTEPNMTINNGQDNLPKSTSIENDALHPSSDVKGLKQDPKHFVFESYLDETPDSILKVLDSTHQVIHYDKLKGKLTIHEDDIIMHIDSFANLGLIDYEVTSYHFIRTEDWTKTTYWENIITDLPEWILYNKTYDFGYKDPRSQYHSTLAGLIYNVNRNSSFIKSFYNRFKTEIFNSVPRLAYHQYAVEDCVNQLIAAHNNISNHYGSLNKMYEVYNQLNSKRDLRANERANVVNNVLSDIYVTESNEWYYTFWARRYSEGNHKVVFSILQEIHEHYK